MAPAQDQSIMNINVKRAVKILGVYFTYDRRLRHKLNFKEIMNRCCQNKTSTLEVEKSDNNRKNSDR